MTYTKKQFNEVLGNIADKSIFRTDTNGLDMEECLRSSDWTEEFDAFDEGETLLADIASTLMDYDPEKLTEGGEYTEEDFLDAWDYDGVGCEVAGSTVPIYYYDYAKWFALNWNLVDEYLDEIGGLSKETTIMDTIRCSIGYSREKLVGGMLLWAFGEMERLQDNNE